MMQFKPVGEYFGVQLWGARSGKWAFMIGHNETGFSASWKDASSTERQSSNYIDGSPFKTIQEAEAACRRTLKAIANPS